MNEFSSKNNIFNLKLIEKKFFLVFNGINYLNKRLLPNLTKGLKMKNLIKTLTVTIMLTFVGSSAFAYGWSNTYSYSSTPNIFGGYNYSGNGWSGSSTPNIFGGYNYSFQDNSLYSW